jgi:hypothetical protein
MQNKNAEYALFSYFAPLLPQRARCCKSAFHESTGAVGIIAPGSQLYANFVPLIFAIL